MDGLPDVYPTQLPALRQHTLKTAIGCVGVGVHSSRRAALTLHPAAPNTGIVFRRTDLGVEIGARYDHVVETRLCTVLADPRRPSDRLGTVEHLMSAAAGCGIDNMVVEVDGPEVPILDGSAAPFVFLFDCAGIVEQDAPRDAIEVLRTIRVEHGVAFAELRPGSFGFDMALSIDFPAPAIGRQALSLRLDADSYRHELAPARTFTNAADVADLRSAGLALGGSLANAIVVDGERVLNPGGLRMPDEFVRHKLVDVVGDLSLAGAPLRARFVAHRSGHSLNNRLLRALFADPSAWRRSTDVALPLQVAA